MWKKLNGIAEANLAEWNRTVYENSALSSDLRALRRKYGLPIKHEEFRYWYDEPKRNQQIEEFHKDVDKLAVKHDINTEKWGSPFFYLIVLNDPGPVSLGSGFPAVHTSTNSEGKMIRQVAPDLETALDNPIVQRYIADIHKQNILAEDPPPSPKRQAGSRKVDWRPVWEWSKRYSNFTKKEIADLLGYSYGTVRSRLSRLDGEHF